MLSPQPVTNSVDTFVSTPIAEKLDTRWHLFLRLYSQVSHILHRKRARMVKRGVFEGGGREGRR